MGWQIRGRSELSEQFNNAEMGPNQSISANKQVQHVSVHFKGRRGVGVEHIPSLVSPDRADSINIPETICTQVVVKNGDSY